MRLWHKDLIPVLPRQQLLGQWRECCCIAKSILAKETPNHILVNRVIDYPATHFNAYTLAVYKELRRRNYNADWDKFRAYRVNRNFATNISDIFPGWHNDRYLKQCYYNLQEKYDCGGITEDEFFKVAELFDAQH